MTTTELFDILRNPELVSQISVDELRHLVETYPYCTSFIFLYLYKLSATKDVRFTSELKKYSPLLPSREKLFASISDEYDLQTDFSGQKEPIAADDPFCLIEDFLGEIQAKGTDLPNELNYSIPPNESKEAKSNSSHIEEKEFSLLGSSDISLEGIVSPMISQEEKSATEEDNYTPSNEYQDWQVSSSQPSEQDEYEEEMFTETLAKIYLKQKRYDKALNILKSIQEKHPNKNPFYADQVRYIEKIIQLTNKQNQ